MQAAATNQGELNTVPLIDMMSTLVAFLLLTASWSEVRAFPTKAPGAGAGPRKDDVATLVLAPGGAFLTRPSGETQSLAPDEIPGALDGLAGTSLIVAAQTGVAYDQVVGAMDLASSRGLTVGYGPPR